MQLLINLIMNSLYGEQIRKDIEESYQCKSEMWMNMTNGFWIIRKLIMEITLLK